MFIEQKKDATNHWGRVLVATRLEKTVENEFVFDWTHFIARGLRPGDAFILVKDRVAHQAANEAARALLQSEQDSILFIDSDASFGFDTLEDLRTLEDGQDLDALQAFYTRRGWPPEAIWFKNNALGDLQQCVVWDDSFSMEVALVGLHFTLIRRSIFEAMFEEALKEDPDLKLKDFDFFYYPRNKTQSEDSAFSMEATRLGFRLGATTKVKTGHISKVTTGWETYQQYMELSGIRDKWGEYYRIIELVSEYTGHDIETVEALASKGSANVRDGLEKIQPDGPEDWRKFYGDPESGYIFELIAWNFSPFYAATIEPLLEAAKNQRVLIVGGGIGGEAAALKDLAGAVSVFELPGYLRNFLELRFPLNEDHIRDVSILPYDKVTDIPVVAREIPGTSAGRSYDLIVAIDTLEHIHPEEFLEVMDHLTDLLDPEGSFYFRNNWEDTAKYPMHFDNSSLYKEWMIKNRLTISRTIEKVNGEFIRRSQDEQAN